MWTRQSVSISADQLLQQALTAERAHRVAQADWEHPRFMPEDIGGPVGPVGSAEGFEVTVTHGAALSGIPAMLGRALESASVPSIQLLSVERVAAWRTSHACCTQDRVSHVRGGRLLLETTVPQGDLRKVELTVDAETYRVVRETLVFHRIGRLEFEAVAPDVQSWAPTRKARSVAAVAPRPTGHELDGAELHARLVLAETGLDMSGDVRVSRTPEAVRVEGTSPSADQQRSAGARLAAIEHVQANLHVGSLSNAARVTMRPAMARPGLDRWLARTFYDRSTRASFLPDLMRSTATVRQRLALLDALAQRYPDARGQLLPDGFAVFQQVVNLHYGKLRVELDELKMRVSVLAGSDSVVQAAPHRPAGLVSRTPIALSHATALEQQAQDLFRQHDLGELERQCVRATFQSLWASVYAPQPPRPPATYPR